MSNTVSQAYLLGIREGRDTLKNFLSLGLHRNEIIKSNISNLKTLLASGFSGEMRETLKGQLDFFKNQEKIG